LCGSPIIEEWQSMQGAGKMATVDGAKLYYDVGGQGEPVVLVHGFSLDLRMWDDQVGPFSQAYQVIRFDARGFGRSSLPGDEVFSAYDDLRMLLDHLRIDRAHVIGLSMGGSTVINFAVTHPDRVRKLVVADSGVGAAPARRPPDPNAEIEEVREEWLVSPLFAPAMEQPAVAQRLRQIIGDYSGYHWVHTTNDQRPVPPVTDRLHELLMPTLVIYGERDTPEVHGSALRLEQGIPNCRRVILPGVGHMSNMEAPAAFNAAVLGFLADES
jgi:3-oxoadipate enol-lactonase